MSFFSKYLVFVGIIGLIGIPIFVFDYSDLSWGGNKESYWGMIAMGALIISQVALFLASKKENHRKLE
jgi:predicted tellurium resistance membrane protein TerC